MALLKSVAQCSLMTLCNHRCSNPRGYYKSMMPHYAVVTRPLLHEPAARTFSSTVKCEALRAELFITQYY